MGKGSMVEVSLGMIQANASCNLAWTEPPAPWNAVELPVVDVAVNAHG